MSCRSWRTQESWWNSFRKHGFVIPILRCKVEIYLIQVLCLTIVPTIAWSKSTTVGYSWSRRRNRIAASSKESGSYHLAIIRCISCFNKSLTSTWNMFSYSSPSNKSFWRDLLEIRSREQIGVHGEDTLHPHSSRRTVLPSFLLSNTLSQRTTAIASSF